MQRMIEIYINTQLVAIVIEDLAKLFVNTIYNDLPLEVSVTTRIHTPQETIEQEKVEQEVAQQEVQQEPQE